MLYKKDTSSKRIYINAFSTYTYMYALYIYEYSYMYVCMYNGMLVCNVYNGPKQILCLADPYRIKHVKIDYSLTTNKYSKKQIQKLLAKHRELE